MQAYKPTSTTSASKRAISGYHSAAARGDVAAIKTLLQSLPAQERVKRANTVNRFGFTPLHSAIFCERTEVITLLIEVGADVNRRADRSQWTYPLHLAALKGSTKLVRMLLAAGADPFLQDWQGFNALNIADLAGNKHVPPILRAKMEATQEDYTNGLPTQLDDLSNGWDDTWWRVRQVHWQANEQGEDDGDQEEEVPLVVDHYSDGGTPAPVLAVQYGERKQWYPKKLYRVLSQPLTLCERERAQANSRLL